MEVLNNLALGFSVAVTPLHLLYALIGVMLGTLICSMASPALRICPIWLRAKMPNASIRAPISENPRSARGAMFMLRNDMVLSGRE